MDPHMETVTEGSDDGTFYWGATFYGIYYSTDDGDSPSHARPTFQDLRDAGLWGVVDRHWDDNRADDDVGFDDLSAEAQTVLEEWDAKAEKEARAEYGIDEDCDDENTFYPADMEGVPFKVLCKKYPWCVAFANNYEAGVTPTIMTLHESKEYAEAEFDRRLARVRRDNMDPHLMTFDRVLPTEECG